MIPCLKGQKAFGYVDGTLKPPPKELTDSNGTKSPNPLFDTWETQDNLILSCLNSSLTDEVLAYVAHCTTSHAIWMALTSAFASQSRAQTIQVWFQLSTILKTTQTASEYFMQIKCLADDLAIAGQPLTPNDVITYLLAGLGPEYDFLVTTIFARDASLTLEEVYSMLLTSDCEAQIQHHSQFIPTSPTSANVPARQSPIYGNHGHGNSSNVRGRGRGSSRGNFCSRNSDLWGQLYEKLGHTASRCYKQYDPYFLPPPAYRNAQANISTNQNQQPTDQEWHADSRANASLMNNFNNLNVHGEEYPGTDQIQVGDGSSLSITHTSTATLPTSSTSFVLDKILVVPQITKNLISVQKFAQDNNVYFEFHNTFFLIKDYLENILHKEHSKDGLYCFPQSFQQLTFQTFVGVRVSIFDWHRWLRHASLYTVNYVLRSNKLPIGSNKW